MPSFQEFSNALTKNGYKVPTKEQYTNFAGLLKTEDGIKSKREAAMFLANIIHETGGLQKIIEEICGSGCAKCLNAYTTGDDHVGSHYCGRGYLQLVIEYIFKN